MSADTSGDAIVIFTNLPDRQAAIKLAQELIERRLAACVNVLQEGTSIYRWKEAIETAQEVPVMIKTRTLLYGEVEATIRRLHPYELPEVVAVPVVRGLPEYLEWVATETTLSIG